MTSVIPTSSVDAVDAVDAVDEQGDSQSPAARRELVLDALRASSGPRTIASLAEQLQVHPNTVRFHLAALRRTGLVDQSLGDTAAPGRPPILFSATRKMDPAGPTNYQLLAAILTSYLASTSPDPTSAAAELGRAWGTRLVDTPVRQGRKRPGPAEALNRLTHLLGDLGFAPETPIRPPDTTIRLRHCPFLAIVGDPISEDHREGRHGNVICSLHLGIMQGALAALDSSVTVDGLLPFAEPDRCVAHIAPAKADTASHLSAAPRRPVPRGPIDDRHRD